MPEYNAENGAQQSGGRPFPWHCPRCRKKEVRPATIPYCAERLSDGKVITVNVPDLIVPKCDHCGELVFNYTAEEQILKTLEGQRQGSAVGPSSPERAANMI
jgi:predicted nucleic-acid-binding Zn-ribbon protein